MELKVWVEGIQRIVCGVTVNTTCQDVVFALAHATGKVGRFTLIERWRNNERLLAPNENPLKLLLKWGEYANDVQFILQRSENKQQNTTQQLLQQQHRTTSTLDNDNATSNISNSQTQAVIIKKPLGLSNTNNSNNNLNSSNNSNNKKNNIVFTNASHSDSNNGERKPQKELNLQAASERTKELKKSFGAYDKQIENIGIVMGIPQQRFTNHNNNNNNNVTTTTNNNGITTNMIAKYSPTSKNVTIKSTTITAAATTFNIKNNKAHFSSPSAIPIIIPKHEKSHSNPIDMTSSQDHSDNNFNSSNSTVQPVKGSFHNNYNSNCSSNNIYAQIGARNSKSTNEIHLADMRETMERRTLSSTTTTTTTSTTVNNKEALYVNNINASGNNNNSPSTEVAKQVNSNQYNSEENLVDMYNGNNLRYSMSGNKLGGNASTLITNESSPSPDLYKNTTPTPTISANGALVPPPYRNPPPPRNSPLQRMQNDVSHSPAMSAGSTGSNSIGSATQFSQQTTATPTTNASTFLNDYSNVYEDDFPLYATPNKNNSATANNSNNNNNNNNNNSAVVNEESESIFQATQYNDLLQLIKFQREKISAQQLELTKYDAEIIFLENKERDQAQELEAISREITTADQIFRQGSEQLQALQYVEEENELVKQQEKTLKSEIALLRSKLSNCETELLQCKNKIRLIMDDIEIEQRTLTQKQKNNRQNFERDFMLEMERIQNEIDQAIMNTDTSNKTAENLKKEIILIEQAIAEKKRQVEKLVNEMKEVNLQSLQVTTSEEIKNLLEGPNKQGSSRRIIGSPRQLENAVPTSKNPHGVWV